jgi:hypothetical protein
MHDRHDLLVRSNFLRREVASITGSPSRVGLDYFLGWVDWLEEWYANTYTASAAIEGAITHHHAGLDPGATLEDLFADIREEFGARN